MASSVEESDIFGWEGIEKTGVGWMVRGCWMSWVCVDEKASVILLMYRRGEIV